MEELKLRRLILHTRHPAELESFMVEVLGAETSYVSADAFEARVSGVCFDVRPGESSVAEFEFEVPPAFLVDLVSRWEFYCFRRGAISEAQRSRSQFSCRDSDGRLWRLQAQALPSQTFPSESVRNY